MPRTTVQKVRTILDTSVDDNTITSWMDIASELVDDIDAADPDVSDSRLAKIEKVLAAHLVSTQDQRIESSSRETASVDYQGETGMHLDATKYGQQAKMLDPTDTLVNLHKSSASVGVPDAKGIK